MEHRNRVRIGCDIAVVVLATTLYDREGVLLRPLREVIPFLRKIYPGAAASVSEFTYPPLIDALREEGWVVKARKCSLGEARRHAIALGLELDPKHLHFCDGDRLILWARKFPAELERTTRTMRNYDFLVMGRTKRAFDTHPKTQRDTENIVNAVCSLLIGREIDVTCGSRGLSKRAADFLLRHSKARDVDTDSEWLMLLHRAKTFKIGNISCEGMEYEDWLKDPEHVRILGYDNWVRTKESDPGEWLLRARYALKQVQSALRAISTNLP